MTFLFDDDDELIDDYDDDELIEAVRQRAEKDSNFADKIRRASQQKDESWVRELINSVVIKLVEATELAIRVARIVRDVMELFDYYF